MPGTATLRLPFVRPYDLESLLAFLAARAIPGVERVDRGEYRRVVAIGGVTGTIAVRLGRGGDHLAAAVRVPPAARPAVAARIRRLFDLDADGAAIDAHLARDPLLAPRVAARPGLRVPGAWDPFELAVRAILGQQISVAAARTLAGRIAAAHGRRLAGADGAGLDLVFPGPERLSGARLDGLGLTRARAAAVTALARAVAQDRSLLEPRGDLEAAVARLVLLPGIGRWTAQYVAMRALREPDAFPDGDLGLVRALASAGVAATRAALLRRAERWRPWRAYAALHLWAGDPAAPVVPRDRNARGHGSRAR
jgi:AraC family transcriptional regulator of adaptative response / DNA-3-methyladenine glycosylase II